MKNSWESMKEEWIILLRYCFALKENCSCVKVMEALLLAIDRGALSLLHYDRTTLMSLLKYLQR